VGRADDAIGYGATAKALHWLAALCVIMAWLIGTFIDDFPKSLGGAAIFTHMSLGLTVLALLFVRLGWRLANPPPPFAASVFSPWSERAATLVHWLLYALMLALPVSGIVLQFARGQAVPLFGLFEIASPWARDRALSRSILEIHELLADSLLILAGLHALAALAHHYVLKDDTLMRMLPGRMLPGARRLTPPPL
jgi:cytochrome b561